MAAVDSDSGSVHSRIVIKSAHGDRYAELRAGERIVSLGRFHGEQPCALLDNVLRAAADFDVDDLFLLLWADKSDHVGKRPWGSHTCKR